MNTFNSATVTIDGTTYEAELAITERTTLGFEDHGIFTAVLHFTGADRGWGQSSNAPCLSHRDQETRQHVAWPGGLQFIIEICQVYGTDWEKITGSLIYVLRSQHFGAIAGIMNYQNRSKFLLFQPTLERLMERYPS